MTCETKSRRAQTRQYGYTKKTKERKKSKSCVQGRLNEKNSHSWPQEIGTCGVGLSDLRQHSNCISIFLPSEKTKYGWAVGDAYGMLACTPEGSSRHRIKLFLRARCIHAQLNHNSHSCCMQRWPWLVDLVSFCLLFSLRNRGSISIRRTMLLYSDYLLAK